VRRLVAVVPATFIALTLIAGPAMADGGHHGGKGGDHKASGQHHAAKPKHEKKHHKPKKHDITLVGVISDTPTATITPSDTSTATVSSDTATSTITIDVKGGDREHHGVKSLVITLDKNTVVRRNGPATAADLRKGDHVSIKARHLENGTWLASRVNASAPEPAKPEDDD